jgi:hypothetical protein
MRSRLAEPPSGGLVVALLHTFGILFPVYKAADLPAPDFTYKKRMDLESDRYFASETTVGYERISYKMNTIFSPLL